MGQTKQVEKQQRALGAVRQGRVTSASPATPTPSPFAEVLGLQRSIGNAATVRLLAQRAVLQRDPDSETDSDDESLDDVPAAPNYVPAPPAPTDDIGPPPPNYVPAPPRPQNAAPVPPGPPAPNYVPAPPRPQGAVPWTVLPSGVALSPPPQGPPPPLPANVVQQRWNGVPPPQGPPPPLPANVGPPPPNYVPAPPPVTLPDGNAFAGAVRANRVQGRSHASKSKSSESLSRISWLLDEAERYKKNNSNLPADVAKELGVLDELTDSCAAWFKVHATDKQWGKAPAYVQGVGYQANVRRNEVARANPQAKSAGYDKTKSKIVKKSQAMDMHSALEHLGFLIDLAVPSVGNKGDVEFEVDIPVEATKTFFVGFRFKAEGERSEAEKLKCRLELAVTGGAHLPGSLGRAAAELGGFSEAQGRSSAEVMRLFSYGLYRRARESNLSSHELTSWLWGGSADKAGFAESERWAGAVEENTLKQLPDAYVHSGGFGRGVAEVGLPNVGKGKFDLQIGGGKQWDKTGIEAIAAAKNRPGINQPQTRPGLGETLKSKAEDTFYVKGSGQVTAGIFKGDAKAEASWITWGRDGGPGGLRPSHFKEAKVEVKGGFYLNAAKVLSGNLFEIFEFEKLAAMLAEFVRACFGANKSNASQGAGFAPQAGTELTEASLQLAGIPTVQFNKAFEESNPLSQGTSVGSTISLGIDVKVKAPRGKPDPNSYEIAVTIGEEQSLRYEAIVGRVKAQTFNRWMRVSRKTGGEWKFDIFGKEFAAKEP